VAARFERLQAGAGLRRYAAESVLLESIGKPADRSPWAFFVGSRCGILIEIIEHGLTANDHSAVVWKPSIRERTDRKIEYIVLTSSPRSGASSRGL